MEGLCEAPPIIIIQNKVILYNKLYSTVSFMNESRHSYFPHSPGSVCRSFLARSALYYDCIHGVLYFRYRSITAVAVATAAAAAERGR